MRNKSRATTWPNLRRTARTPRDHKSSSRSKYLEKRRTAQAREETGMTRRRMGLSRSGSQTTALRTNCRRETRREDPGPPSARMTPRNGAPMKDRQTQKWLTKRGRSQYIFQTILSCQLMIAPTAAMVATTSSVWLLIEKWPRNSRTRNQRLKVKKWSRNGNLKERHS